MAPGCAAWRWARSAWGLHHKLCHTLGGSFDLPHAPTHAVVLPYALAYNAAAAPEAVAALRRVMGEGDVAVALHRFGQRIGAPSSLRTSASTRATSIAPPTLPRPGPTRTRGRSSAVRSARCWTMHTTDGHPAPRPAPPVRESKRCP